MGTAALAVVTLAFPTPAKALFIRAILLSVRLDNCFISSDTALSTSCTAALTSFGKVANVSSICLCIAAGEFKTRFRSAIIFACCLRRRFNSQSCSSCNSFIRLLPAARIRDFPVFVVSRSVS